MAKIYFFKKVSEMILTEERAKTIQESTVYDVAKAFLHLESMTPKKLQKLCYYAYSFYLAIYEKKLFDDNFEAWVHGPVNPQLYTEYREYGWQEIPQEINYPNSIMKNERVREIIEEVYDSYGHLDGNQLEYLTHQEDPWKNAREGLQPYESSRNVINDEDIRSYYAGVLKDG
ncbi:Panacea domain-containing protein [Paenibacillus larvae]|uniref:Putative phage protein n=1 Tax=Paenibacillus larvae subsp. larvae TaxID=147375 RepID=A0A6C0QPZ5_9BACL|nr:type II toxin-antitoxin system antitoxin SocA domain-containing protein [Paenibacillus larvae]QHZ50733.1 putative phage protein [Paenibacillus larvae subsp. larvae]QHZ51348.1 putative phage protein [Paenibacillus larvae subsp. larvae]QHZ52697.1 putative phage protein [Paenibacillus larvae subsp. larvae]